ncbi:MAG: N-acetylglucosamine-6-phosphate deacetylase [Burkholderiales bacterium]|nr:N-acetylglucosamine-6-phosphate deacetylase [Burkholderiales bacterium]
MTSARQWLQGCVLTPGGWVRGGLALADGRVADISGEPLTESAARASGLPLWLPGFIDLHVHGGGGHDTMAGGAAVAAIARCHARHGTTSLLATTMTAPRNEIEAALRALAPQVAQRPRNGARVLGVHLEGPYLSPHKLGAQPDFVAAATLDDVLALHALAPLRLITLAPERPGHLALIVALRQRGFVVQIGHSAGRYEDGVAALAAGATGFTHLFNAMSAMHHREPGLVGAALAHAERAEIIPDLLHVHPGAIHAALRAIPGLYCVTDATAAAGMPDGEYALGRHRVTKCLGGVRLADGTLAGSTLTMDQALRNLVGLGLTLAEASRRTATLAAQHLGLADRGEIRPGAWADLVALDSALQLQQVWVEAEAIEPEPEPEREFATAR